MIREGVLTKREKLCLKYRWEFLRRNREYQKDYFFIIMKLNVVDIIKNSYPHSLVKKALKILSKWDLLNPIPPKLSFDALLRSDKKLKSFYLDSLIVDELAIDCFENPDLLSTEELYVKASYLDMRIDMRFPKEKILDEFKFLVDNWQKRLKKAMKSFPNSKPEPRLQIDQYDRYLKVYDQHRKGVSFDKLAKKFYPNYVESPGMNYAQLKVQRDISSCLKLIHGGFKQIR